MTASWPIGRRQVPVGPGANVGVAVMARDSGNDSVLKARIAELEAQLAAANKPRALSARVAPAGGVSVYGLGRFPVTLYTEQWTRLFSDARPLVEVCIAAHPNLVDRKDDSEAEKTRKAAARRAAGIVAKPGGTGLDI